MNVIRLYLDLVVILNFLVDFLLLMGTNRLAGFPAEPMRAAAGAALGAAYSGVCLLPRLRFLGNTLWRVISLTAIAVIAFGWNRSALKRGGVFVLLSMALGGIALSFGRSNFPALILSAVGIWVLCRIAFGSGIGSREYVPLEISYGERRVKLIALRDSGNTLRDPVTGEPVLVIDSASAQALTGLTLQQLRAPLETLTAAALPGLRLIPYRAVGQSGGMLLAMRFHNVKIGPRHQTAIVAFAAEGLGRGEVHQALTGGSV